MNRKNLIISADDFGLNAKANRNILELAKLGKIDRASVMMFGKYTPEDIRAILGTGVKLDVHLHLERMKRDAFQNNGARRSLARRLGNFSVLFLKKGRTGRVREEWLAQTEEFRRLFGKNPDGINSHEYIHYFPPYFKLALEMRKKFSFSYFRFGTKGISGITLKAMILKLMRVKDKEAWKKSGLPAFSSDYLLSFDWTSESSEFFKNIPSGAKTEVVFHPEREGEFEFLKTLRITN